MGLRCWLCFFEYIKNKQTHSLGKGLVPVPLKYLQHQRTCTAFGEHLGKLPYAAALGWTPSANRPLTSYLLSTSGLTFLPFIESGANCFFLTCLSQGKWFLKGTATPSSGLLFRAGIPPMHCTQAHGLQGSPTYGSSTSGFQRR